MTAAELVLWNERKTSWDIVKAAETKGKLLVDSSNASWHGTQHLQRASEGGHLLTELVEQLVGGVHVIGRVADREEVIGVRVTVDAVEFDEVGVV